MKRLITMMLFAFSLMVIGSAFATIEKQKVKDERSEKSISVEMKNNEIDQIQVDLFNCENADHKKISETVCIDAKEANPSPNSKVVAEDATAHIKDVEPRTDLHLDPGLK